MFSIRFIVTCISLITGIVLYIMFLVKKDGYFACMSLFGLFLAAVTDAAMLIKGVEWMFAY